MDENIDNNSCTFCGLKAAGTPVNFMSGAKTTLPQRDFLLKGINGFDLDFYRLYSNQVREEVPQALKTMVRGNVSDSNIHTVLVNGSPTSVINGVWQKEVTLTPGANTITATAEVEGIPLQDTAEVTAVTTSRHSLGAGWTHSFNLSLSREGDGAVFIQAPNGRDINFYPDGQGGYLSINGARSTLVPQLDGSFRWIEGDGKTYTFDADGFLTEISDRFSNTISLSYQSNHLTAITDTTERQLTFSYNASGNLEHIDGPTGQLASYTYDASGNLSTAVNNAGETTTYNYQDSNDPHNLTAIQNDAGQTILNVQYDTQDRAIAVDVGAGGANGLSISYDAPGQTTVTNLEGGVTVYEYTYDPVNGSGSITTTGAGCSTCGGGNVASEEFGPNYTLTSATDRNGNTATYTYDSRGNVLTKTEASGTPQQRTTTYTWHPDFNFVLTEMVESVLDPQDVRLITYDYDDDGDATPNESPGLSIRRQVVEGLTRNGSGALVSFEQITLFDYDSLGHLTQVDGPRTGVDDTIDLTYYPIQVGDPKSGMLESVTQTNGTTSLTTTYDSYDSRGNATQITDPNGQITTYTYDAMNHVSTITQQGDTNTYTYDANGNIDLVTLPGGNHIDYTYDAANRLTQINDDLGNRIQYAYDTQGNRTREERKDPGGVIKTYLDMQYDTLNRLDRITNPDSSYTAYDYDPNGNRTGLTDPNGNTTTYEYDALNRTSRMIQPGAINTVLDYDVQDHLISVTDGNSNTTTYEYDDAGRVVKLISPDTGTTIYTYDDAGNLATKKNANNILTTYSYDALNRLTHIAFPDSSQDITYNYDGATSNGLGRLTGMSDPSGTTTYYYTAKGQLDHEVKTFIGLSGSFTTTYSYDANGNLARITYPGGRQVTYTLDSADRITQVSGSHGGPSTTYATISNYLPYGSYQSLSFGNGQSTTVTYDNRYQFDGQTVGSGPQLLSHDYSHDANGNVTAISDLLNSAKNKTYGYDVLDRLSSATGPWPSSGSLSYTYDPVGNRLTEGGSLGSSTYSYADNLLTDITGAKNKTFSYDANGNTVVENNRIFVYDQNNRLVQVTENSITLGTYVYDVEGRRVKKVAGGQTTYFLYDQESRLIVEADASGDVVTEYLYLPDRPLVKIDIDGSTETVLYHHADHLGTPLFLTNSSGQKVWSAELLPFGEGYDINEDVDGNQVNVVNNLRFPGQYYDAETGLHYNVMRDYNPPIGRYTQSDPIGLAGGINTFAYVGNNSVNSVDPWGLQSSDSDKGQWGPVTNALWDFWKNYRSMKDANTIGADKYFHCKAHCQAAKEGPVGKGISVVIGEGREYFDEYINNPLKGIPKDKNVKDCNEDREANRRGREGDKNKPCSQTCSPLRPPGLDPKY